MIGEGSRGVFLLCLWLALAGGAPHAANATIFDDGNDRKLVNDLRARETRGEELTEIELAVLEAANRVGVVSLCNQRPDEHSGGVSGSASLIQFHGRLAVVTSAHYLVESETREHKCPDSRARNALFYPNMSWASLDDELSMDAYRLEYPPENLGNYLNSSLPRGRGIASGRDPDDFLVFYLVEDIARDKMPDGRVRGAFQPAVRSERSVSEGHMVGFAPDIQNGVPAVYQLDCGLGYMNELTYHSCDSIAGSSGSTLLRFENGAMRFAAVHNFRGLHASNAEAEFASPEYMDLTWNGGSPASVIFRDYPNAPYSEVPPDRLVYHLQRALKDAGCYDAALDNQWGPASRVALAEFKAQSGAGGEALAGTEPGRALLDAVRGLLPTVACR